MTTNITAIRTVPHAIASEIIYLLSSSIGSPKAAADFTSRMDSTATRNDSFATC